MTGGNIKPASEVIEDLLRITRKAILANDFQTFLTCFTFPHRLSSSEKKDILENEQDMRKLFDTLLHYYTLNGMTDLVRYCDVAEYSSPTRIEATHITHVMAGNRRVTDPFPAYSVIELIEGSWKITASQYAVDSKTAVGLALAEMHKGPQNNSQKSGT